jgi:heat shock protein HslJ
MQAVLIAGLSALVLVACAPPAGMQASTTPAPPDMHNSRNALDWAGTYEGIVPCANCPGTETRLTLRTDGSYERSTRTVGDATPPRIVRGQFEWARDGNVVTLDAAGGGQRFAVREGSLALLDAAGAPAAMPTSDRLLRRVAAAPAATTQSDLAQRLGAWRWRLASAADAQGRPIEAVAPGPGRTFEMAFADATLGIQGRCNRMNGGWRLDAEGRLNVLRLASTQMACEPAAMQADDAMAKLLSTPMKIDLSGGASPVLRLASASGEVLVFNGQATPESRYGPATLAFLEVAPQRIACPDAPNAGAACLQVRERVFDAQGLPVGAPGVWRALEGGTAGGIEGFTHTPGQRNVLRVKRFERGPAQAGSPRYAYVLDLVIESETVAR